MNKQSSLSKRKNLTKIKFNIITQGYMNMQSENINELMGALALAQGEISGAVKDSNNPFFKSKYADLSSVWNACRMPLSRNGLAVTQTTLDRDGITFLITTLGHKSGQFMKSELPVKLKTDGKTNELQVLGSVLTYLRRYALSAIVGVAPDDDDDGNSANSGNGMAKPAGPIIISKEQAQVLNDTINRCPVQYQQQVLSHLKTQGIHSINILPLILYDRVLDAAKKKSEETHAHTDV